MTYWELSALFMGIVVFVLLFHIGSTLRDIRKKLYDIHRELKGLPPDHDFE